MTSTTRAGRPRRTAPRTTARSAPRAASRATSPGASRPAPSRTARPARPRWQRRKHARPAELIAAALETFTERGFAATRLEDVARRAGVTKGTMYLYFESKDALFKAMVREAVVPALERGEQFVEEFQGPSRDLLANLVRGWWKAISDSRMSGLPKLMISEAANFPELARFYHREVVQRGRRLMGRALVRGIQSGEFRPVDVEYAVRVLVSPVILAATWKHSFLKCEPGPYDFGRFIEVYLDLVLDGLDATGKRGASHG